MATPLRVGVLAVQGAVSEHIEALVRAASALGTTVDAVPVRTAAELAGVAGIILPGGESTTISRLLRRGNLQGPLQERGRDGSLAVFGTCAGLILLCRDATRDVEGKDIQLLGLLDATVDRNAFGRQKDSFESALQVSGIGSMPAVFIRAPVLVKVEEPTQVLARNQHGIVAVQKGLILGTAFHPELTPDTRLHERFLALAGKASSVGAKL